MSLYFNPSQSGRVSDAACAHVCVQGKNRDWLQRRLSVYNSVVVTSLSLSLSLCVTLSANSNKVDFFSLWPPSPPGLYFILVFKYSQIVTSTS